MYKLIFKIGQRLRNPSLHKIYNFLKESENWTLQELEDYQLKKSKELLEHAYHNSKFYKKLFETNNFHPSDFNSLKDFKKIPIINKTHLVKNNEDVHTNITGVKKMKAISSGTSGLGLSFYRDEVSDSFNRASVYRGYSWYNIKPWHKNGYFWGFDFSFKNKLKTKFFDKIQNRFRIFGYEDKEFKRFIKKLKKAKYIHGYSSAIYQTAKLINARGINLQNILMVKGTSEKIFDSYQKDVLKAFGVKMISEYGATESGIIAFECPSGKLHINMEAVYVEEINKEIVITNLHSKNFPFIRYKLGDIIELESNKSVCECGMHHKVIKEITGRIGSGVYGKSHIYPSFTFYYIFKNLKNNHNLVLNYQVIQEKKGALEFRIEQELNKENLEILKNEIIKYFKDDILFNIIPAAEFLKNNGKLKAFIPLENE